MDVLSLKEKGFVYKWYDTSNDMYYIGCHKNRIKSNNFKDIYYMNNDFELSDDFADFVDELTNDEKNDNAQCSIDNPECEACGS